MNYLKQLILSSATILVMGCETVAPWDRDVLARPEMQLSTDPMGDALFEQVYLSKEASSGGYKTAGGGCGCN